MNKVSLAPAALLFRVETPSQILPSPPYLHGPLADARRRLRPARISLEMFPAAPTRTSDGHEHCEPPACGWAISSDRGNEDGPLSLMSFLALWNDAVRRIDGLPVEMSIHDRRHLAGTAFVQLHPSGFLQAISYDSAGFFRREILYPLS